ncbi:Helix-turn-helix domain protein [Candidatus Xenohaliotis californiensis]|uniref:Helix-turn-helix domain protein n=1 Tax=Candidatus Xenohaliotis californiensis TaxID=84677 RepID=A0ABM9N7U2_9RICK|nr:Helix-turn-helix domain protein [Candidatus Xenohaliotis californiensis]
MTNKNIIALAFSPKETAILIAIGKTKVFELIKNKELKSIKIGARRLTILAAIKNYITQLEVSND